MSNNQHEVKSEMQHFDVKVLYNGITKAFKVHLPEKVERLREQAIKAFSPIANSHLLGLFDDGAELKDSDTIKEAGLTPCDELLLRPSEVRGGA